MKMCLKLAKKADGKTSPNPLVGCVVLDKTGKIIAKGYHKKCGEYHAERNALLSIDKQKAKGGTLIVNLEPCSHYGKTPPCADLIVEYKLAKVVYGLKDPNPKVAGKGLKILKDAGIEVIGPVLENECKNLNEVFLKNIEQNKCFVALKTATTLDGKIATENGDSKWITSDAAREEVQKIRNRYDAILTSSSTVIKDNPSMTCRMKNGKNPVRVVIDTNLKTDINSKIYTNDRTKIYLAISDKVKDSDLKGIPTHIEIIKCPIYNNSGIDLEYLLSALYKKGINSVLVEAGGKLNGSFLKLGLVDKIYQFIAPKVLGDKTGINAFEGLDTKKINNSKNFKFTEIVDYNPDILVIYK
ncbi:MAG: bifunctional diaminohydroxyphosphoribosylaminopyrimidine deaminase/5-amino-6-(5-phosphoribosylamino)uracil reductase RibD [bacterium]|nr:bifunctional diaminohydroxyphosphoribosylaminopyrimidine deaminase/5-amino-6-(5-phosphoribosylamino)uracil reductase RibD [bacterium]